jgi:hypothetical protein
MPHLLPVFIAVISIARSFPGFFAIFLKCNEISRALEWIYQIQGVFRDFKDAWEPFMLFLLLP